MFDIRLTLSPEGRSKMEKRTVEHTSRWVYYVWTFYATIFSLTVCTDDKSINNPTFRREGHNKKKCTTKNYTIDLNSFNQILSFLSNCLDENAVAVCNIVYLLTMLQVKRSVQLIPHHE